MLTIFEQQPKDLNSLIHSLNKNKLCVYYVPNTRRREMQSQRKIKEGFYYEKHNIF